MSDADARALGRTGPRVGPLALGSWQTLDRITSQDGIALMAAALDEGVHFFDVARYTPANGGLADDGATELAFARNLKALGDVRADLVVAGKAWSDRRPEIDLRGEVEQSVDRLGVGWLDLLYLDLPPEGVGVGEVLAELPALLADGTIRSWGLMAWPDDGLAAVDAVVADGSLPAPAAVQLPYNVIWRQPLDSAPCRAFLDQHGSAVVASAPLAYGLLTGKYARADGEGRMAADWPALAGFVGAPVAKFLDVAQRCGVSPTHLALAFVLRHPRVTSALFGARTVAQLRENVAVVEVAAALPADVLEQVRAVPPFDALPLTD